MGDVRQGTELLLELVERLSTEIGQGLDGHGPLAVLIESFEDHAERAGANAPADVDTVGPLELLHAFILVGFLGYPALHNSITRP